MRVLKGIILVLFVTLYVSCASTDPLFFSRDGVTVTVDEEIAEDRGKLKALKSYEVVETINRYVTHRFKKLDVRKTMEVKINITSFRVKRSGFSGGVSRMVADVVVEDGGFQLTTFTKTTATVKKRKTSVKRMSKDLAKKIYDEIEGF